MFQSDHRTLQGQHFTVVGAAGFVGQRLCATLQARGAQVWAPDRHAPWPWQPPLGHVLGHVQDLGLDVADPNVRIYQTNERQTYHTDSCDIVGLLCLKTAQSGGLSALVSSTTIFNEMRRRRPDLLKLLFQPLATDRRGEVPEAAISHRRAHRV